MDEKALLLLLRKVEQGTALSAEELSSLDEEARRAPSIEMRLAYAHALINGERHEEALPMLQSLVRDHPRHPGTLLGLARAYVAAERYSDAERVVNEGLTHNPGDPELLKTLAVFALRRNERELAKKLVSEALERDPFDSDAQLISAELDAPGTVQMPNPDPPAGAPVTIASEKTFIAALLDELKATGVPHARKGANVYLKANGGALGRVNLSALYDSYVNETRPLSDVVRDMARQLGSSSEGAIDKASLLDKVRPVLRRSDFTEKAVGAANRAISSSLRLFYVLDDPELVRYVPERLASSLGVDEPALHERAMANLARVPFELKRVRISGSSLMPTGASSRLVALWHGDGYDGARLLLPEVREMLRVALGGKALAVNLGHREYALVSLLEDAETTAELRALAALDGIAGALTLSEDDTLA